jgi:hypothetical protein
MLLQKERQKMETTQKSNVVVFPKAKKDSPIQSLDEIFEQINEAKKVTAEVIAEDVVSALFTNFAKYNVTVKEKYSNNFMKDVALIIESIKSGVFRSLEFEHPLHDVAENMFDIKNDNEVKLNLDRLIIREEVDSVTDDDNISYEEDEEEE